MTPVPMSGSRSFSRPTNGLLSISAGTPASICMTGRGRCVMRMRLGGGSGIPPSKRVRTIGALSPACAVPIGRRRRARWNRA
jgi:hypothetical protein